MVSSRLKHTRARWAHCDVIEDPVVKPDQFAAMTCEDVGLPAAIAPIISKQIQEQLSEHKISHADLDMPDASSEDQAIRGQLEDEDDGFWEMWRKRLNTTEDGDLAEKQPADRANDVKTEANDVMVKEEVFDAPMVVSRLPRVDIKRDTELRIMIKVSPILGILASCALTCWL